MNFRIIERKPPELILEWRGFDMKWTQAVDDYGRVKVFSSPEEARRAAEMVQAGESKGLRVVSFWALPLNTISEVTAAEEKMAPPPPPDTDGIVKKGL